MVQGILKAAQINFGSHIGYNRQIQQPLAQHRPQQQQLEQQVLRAQRQGSQPNNDPLLVGILQTLTTNAQNHYRLVAEQKLESNKYLMFPNTVYSGDNIIEACQYWTNFEKYVTTQSEYNILASCNELCETFLATLSGRAYHWFHTIEHTITSTND